MKLRVGRYFDNTVVHIAVLEYCDSANLDIRAVSNIIACVIIATFTIYLTSQYCKIVENEFELYNNVSEEYVSGEHNDES